MKKIALSTMMICLVISQVLAQGYYIEYKLTGDGGMAGTTKSYTQGGNYRAEIEMSGGQMPGGFKLVSLTLKDNPQKSYQLNETSKTYTEVDISSALAHEKDSTEYTVTLVGKEKIDGYNCTHVIAQRIGYPNQEEFWVSTEVLNYKMYMGVKSKYTSEGLFKALAKAGALGFPVRTKVTERGKSMQIDLVKAEARNNDPALFSLEGYTKSGIAGSGTTGSQEDMKRIQNMTPEERQKFIDELRKQHPAAPSAPH